MSKSGSIESQKDYAETPRGRQQYWKEELSASQDMTKAWRKQADHIVNRFTGKRTKTGEDVFNLNLFHSNVTTLASMLYANTQLLTVAMVPT